MDFAKKLHYFCQKNKKEKKKGERNVKRNQRDEADKTSDYMYTGIQE